MKLYLWLLKRKIEYYDAYTSCIVVSESEEKAKRIHPSSLLYFIDDKWQYKNSLGEFKICQKPSWVKSLDEINITQLGIAFSWYEEGNVIYKNYKS